MKEPLKYTQRMEPIWNQLKRGVNAHERAWNRALLLQSRKGNYLIKKINKDECLYGVGYIEFTSRCDGWSTWSTRNEAQWFTKEEALELTKTWKGVKIVKR